MDFLRRAVGSALLGGLLLGALPAGAAPAPAEAVTVVVRATSIRKDRQFYAPALGQASYGDRLAVLGKEGDWVHVRAGSLTGWVHASAVTEKTVKAEARAPSAAAQSDEDVALAGKGFNPQVEKEYRKQNPEANYAAVDRMEKLTVSEKDVAAFLREGHLTPRGGER